jgi:hypothetical protein
MGEKIPLKKNKHTNKQCGTYTRKLKELFMEGKVSVLLHSPRFWNTLKAHALGVPLPWENALIQEPPLLQVKGENKVAIYEHVGPFNILT